MIWRVPYGFYRKNILKIYGIAFLILAIVATAGWFVKEACKIDELQAAGASFIISAGLLILIVPVIFQKGISEYVKEKQKQKNTPAND